MQWYVEGLRASLPKGLRQRGGCRPQVFCSHSHHHHHHYHYHQNHHHHFQKKIFTNYRPGKFAPKPLLPSLHPPSPLLLLPSLSLEVLVLVLVLGLVVLDTTECQRCWLSVEIHFSKKTMPYHLPSLLPLLPLLLLLWGSWCWIFKVSAMILSLYIEFCTFSTILSK